MSNCWLHNTRFFCVAFLRVLTCVMIFKQYTGLYFIVFGYTFIYEVKNIVAPITSAVPAGTSLLKQTRLSSIYYVNIVLTDVFFSANPYQENSFQATREGSHARPGTFYCLHLLSCSLSPYALKQPGSFWHFLPHWSSTWMPAYESEELSRKCQVPWILW